MPSGKRSAAQKTSDLQKTTTKCPKLETYVYTKSSKDSTDEEINTLDASHERCIKDLDAHTSQSKQVGNDCSDEPLCEASGSASATESKRADSAELIYQGVKLNVK